LASNFRGAARARLVEASVIATNTAIRTSDAVLAPEKTDERLMGPSS
jgi:hypothetical protein